VHEGLLAVTCSVEKLWPLCVKAPSAGAFVTFRDKLFLFFLFISIAKYDACSILDLESIEGPPVSFITSTNLFFFNLGPILMIKNPIFQHKIRT